MKGIPINFFLEDISYKLSQKGLLRVWILQVILSEGYNLKELNLIFCNDSYLLAINKDFLHYNTLTDIITFDTRIGIENSDNNRKKKVLNASVSGDIYISIQRVKENAHSFNITLREEVHRVIIHGVLHLLGYKDKSVSDKKLMTGKEDYYLSIRKF